MAKQVITIDHIEKGADAGITGREGAPTPGKPMFKFRLKDDGQVYYEGLCNDNNSQDAFAPLDDFGMPNAGCTSIEYFNNGSWEVLQKREG